MRRLLAIIALLLSAGAVWGGVRVTADVNGNFYKYWLNESSREGTTLSYAKSIDQGITYSQPAAAGRPQTLYSFSAEAQFQDLTVNQNQGFIISYSSGESAYYIKSGAKGFSSPVRLYSPGIFAVDSFGQTHFLSVSVEAATGLKKLKYALLTSIQSLESTFEARTVFETYDEIINLEVGLFPWGVGLGWQTKYLDRRETFIQISLNHGRDFGRPRGIALSGELAGLEYFGGGWKMFNSLVWLPVSSAPAPPQITFPTENLPVNAATLEIKYAARNADPVLCRLDLSPDNYFFADKTRTFEFQHPVGTEEAAYQLPPDLPEGKYAARIAVFDGLAIAPSKIVHFSFDRKPQLTLLKPGEKDWFKPGAAILIEATVSDPLNSLEDEAEGEVTVSGAALAEKLIYDKAAGKISGFVSLPEKLTIGRLPARIILSDAAGSLSVREFNVNIKPATAETFELPITVGLPAEAGRPTLDRSVRASAIINKFGAAPTPFSPSQDSLLYFTYELSAAANLKIYLFDLDGTLIWQREMRNTSGGSLSWDGLTQFGAAAPNGLYPFLLQVSAAGSSEIKRGHVIVLQ